MNRNRQYLWAALFVVLGCSAISLVPVAPAVAQAIRPLLVIDVENPARQAFEQYHECLLNTGDLSCVVDVTVPSRKLLVVETVTARAIVPDGQSAVAGAVNLSTAVDHALTLEAQGLFDNGARLAGTHPIRLYVGDGAVLRLFLSRSDDAGVGFFGASVSGHLVNCGPGPGCPIP